MSARAMASPEPREASLARVTTEPLGGSALSRAAQRGEAPTAWYVPRPAGADGWREQARAVARDFTGARWLDLLAPALGDGASLDGLRRVARDGGVLVTTGQQPGLFGGPLLAWVKALSAVALAREIEARCGIPAAPLFWAATDDADFEEARWTMLAVPGGAERLALDLVPPAGTPMSRAPLSGMQPLFVALEAASGSAVWGAPLDAARAAYVDGATVGDSYVALLRALLEPLGMAVLDASHPVVRSAARPILDRALVRSGEVANALRQRDAELRAAGHEPQVEEVPGLSLVFSLEGGVKRRLSIGEQCPPDAVPLSPNVLLRPVVERAILPTAAYVAGPGEIAYFAQSTAVADALGAARPLVVPRWSTTIVEPRIERLLDRLGVAPEELRSLHAVEGRLARTLLPEGVLAGITGLREQVEAGLAGVEVADAHALVPSAAVQGARAAILHRLDRLERRYLAAAKRHDDGRLRDLRTAAGALHPDGRRQERALNFLPMLARSGPALLDAMLAEARKHAASLVGGAVPSSPSVPEGAVASAR